MQEIVLKIKDNSKKEFLLTLLKQFSFVDISYREIGGAKNNKTSLSDIYGIWKDKDVSLDNIRKKAWREENS
ncbi:MAG TPA: hypothetical protein PK385_02650 [Spirochaetota bacterium]|nr:hypothetical protein [Spirochaetota bacterium]HOS34140.1 hypothetical protein [Spirochaetota bacterium]HOS54938.1 hypothetical protein [Spirochaetota bacterium]HPK62767.1 hypothetical protein [Spirochaetota bacterium]HQF79148.1 hypothetical protein [Spirochaetota bacterium]